MTNLVLLNNVHTIIFNEDDITSYGSIQYLEEQLAKVPTHIKSTTKWIQINLKNGFKKWKTDISKFAYHFLDASQFKFRWTTINWNIITDALISRSHERGGTSANVIS